MSVATPAASRLLCRSLAANSAKTSSRAVAASSRTTAPASTTPATAPAQSCTQQRHQFHTSTPRSKRRSPFRNVKAEKMGLYDTDKAEVTRKAQNKVSPDYDDTDIESLQKRYTPEQLKAITLGESVIPAKDLVLQGRMRNDPYRMQYVDDFATIQETVDKRVKTGKPVDTSARFLSQDEFEDDFLDWTSGGKRRDDVDAGEAYKLFEEMRSKMLSKADGGELTVADLEDAMDRVPVGHGIRREPGTARLEFGVPHEELEAMTPQERQKKFEEFLAKIPDESLEEMVEEDEKRKLRAKLSKKGLEGVALEAAVEKELEQPTDDGGLFTHKYIMEHNAMTGFNGGDTALAPGLPDKVPGVAGLYKKEMDDEEAKLDPEGKFQELKRQTGLSIREIIALFNRNSKVLVRRYVSNQTRLGKIRSSYVLAIAGNEDGWLGLGEAKSTDSETATNKAKLAAIRNMQPIRRYENRTIYGHVEAKIGGTIVQLYSRPPGFGLRLSHRFFEIARAAGLQDLAGKMPRSRNPMNSVKACVQALMNQPDPEQIAMGRGRKLVDARKVYYGGAVY